MSLFLPPHVGGVDWLGKTKTQKTKKQQHVNQKQASILEEKKLLLGEKYLALISSVIFFYAFQEIFIRGRWCKLVANSILIKNVIN